MEEDANAEPSQGPSDEWTSWEGYNFVLKGLVDELISLGAKPKLKVIALQLWVKYLGKLEVAFTSKTEQLVPKFGLNQTAKDYTIIKDYISVRKNDLKRKLAEKKSELDNVLQDSTPLGAKKLRLGKNVITDYETLTMELKDSINVLSEIDDRLSMFRGSNGSNNRSQKTTNRGVGTANRIQYNELTARILSKILVKGNSNTGDDNEVNQQAVGATYRYSKFSSCYDPMLLTRQKVLALLCLAMMFTKSDIQISDILRWISEGHLSYFNVTRLLPEGVMVSNIDVAFIRNTPTLRYKSLQQCICNMAELLEIKEFPAPNLLALTHRFLQELQLPAELNSYVEKLIVSCQVHKCVGMMSYEATVMAFIVVVLKTLFGLDGKTEHRTSNFSRNINRLLESDIDEKVRLKPKLFVWDDWVSYINCRKSIIIDKHFPSKDRYTNDRNLATDAAPYVRYCTEEQIQNQHIDSKKICRQSRNAAHKKRMTKLKEASMELPLIQNGTYTYEFAPSLTPYMSYLTTILSCQNAEGNGSNRKTFRMLSYNHTATTLDFLIHPKRVMKFACKRGVHVTVENSSANGEISYVPYRLIHSQVRPTGSTVFIDIINKNDGNFRHGLNPASIGNSADGERVSPNTVSGKGKLISHSREGRRKKKRNSSSCNSKNSTSRCCTLAETGGREGGNSSDLTLFLPFSSYWVYNVRSQQPEGSFETVIERQFSTTFRWLLNECCKMLDMKSIELYTQIRKVEQLCFGKAGISSMELHFYEKSLGN